MTDLQETIIRCSMCNCNKLPKFFKVRENTDMRYRACMECGDKSKWKRDKKGKDMKCPQLTQFITRLKSLNVKYVIEHLDTKDKAKRL